MGASARNRNDGSHGIHAKPFTRAGVGYSTDWKVGWAGDGSPVPPKEWNGKQWTAGRGFVQRVATRDNLQRVPADDPQYLDTKHQRDPHKRYKTPAAHDEDPSRKQQLDKQRAERERERSAHAARQRDAAVRHVRQDAQAGNAQRHAEVQRQRDQRLQLRRALLQQVKDNKAKKAAALLEDARAWRPAQRATATETVLAADFPPPPPAPPSRAVDPEEVYQLQTTGPGTTGPVRDPQQHEGKPARAAKGNKGEGPGFVHVRVSRLKQGNIGGGEFRNPGSAPQVARVKVERPHTEAPGASASGVPAPQYARWEPIAGEPGPGQVQVGCEVVDRHLTDPGRLSLEAERNRFGWGGDFEATKKQGAAGRGPPGGRQKAWTARTERERPVELVVPATEQARNDAVREGHRREAAMRRNEERAVRGPTGPSRLAGPHHLQGQVLPDRPPHQRAACEAAAARAPTLIARHDAAVAVKETEKLFAQMMAPMPAGPAVPDVAAMRREGRGRAHPHVADRRVFKKAAVPKAKYISQELD